MVFSRYFYCASTTDARKSTALLAEKKQKKSKKPEKTIPLFSDHPFGVANTTGTPTTKAKDTAIKANNEI
jgi:hypothetical protein